MKKRSKITPFAKIVIAGIIFLGLRYLYLNKEELISGDLFNFSDTTEVVNDITVNSDTISTDNALVINSDSLKNTADSVEISEDTLTINVEKSNDVLIIKSSDFSINIVLSDSVLVSDTIFFEVSDEKNVTGRIIIK